jgi:hypothetical protein
LETAKEGIDEVHGKLPNNCSLEDTQYSLYVLEKVRNGIEAAISQGTVPHKEAEAWLRKWMK